MQVVPTMHSPNQRYNRIHDWMWRHVIRSIFQIPLKHWQAWNIDLSRKPASVLTTVLVNKCLLRSCLNLPWCKFEPLPRELLLDIKEEPSAFPSPFPSSGSCREQWGHPSASCSPNKPSQSLYLHLTGHAFQPFQHFYCPLMDASKDLCIHLKLWGPDLHTALEVRLHPCWIQQDNHLFWPAADTAPQDVLCPLACQAPLLT